MKWNLLSNLFNLIVSTLLLAVATTSCTKKTTDVGSTTSREEFATAAKGSNLNSLPIVSLRVTINDANGYNITSDGKGDYLNGIDYVQAILDQAGTFAFNTFSPPQKIKNGSVKRWVVYNFNNPVDAGNNYRPSPNNSHNCHFSTGGSPYGTNPFIPLQNLGVNGNPATECIYMGNGMANNTTTWKVSFHKGLEDTQTSPTAFATVTRVSSNVWIITPMGTCSPNSNVASLRDNVDNTLYGYYLLPFSFTLTKR